MGKKNDEQKQDPREQDTRKREVWQGPVADSELEAAARGIPISQWNKR